MKEIACYDPGYNLRRKASDRFHKIPAATGVAGIPDQFHEAPCRGRALWEQSSNVTNNDVLILATYMHPAVAVGAKGYANVMIFISIVCH
jgi:hypothetical protein